MAAVTTLGFPYPTPSDAIAACAAKIQALAQFVDDNCGLIKRGRVSLPEAVGATIYSQAVVFTNAFPGIPDVVATVSDKAVPAAYEPVCVTNVTAAGFTIYHQRSAGGSPVQISWIAVYQ